MPLNDFEEMLKKAVQRSAQAKPGRIFSFKLKMLLRKKAWDMYLRRIFAGGGFFKFAGATALIALLTLSGGIGAYAYTSPDVTVLHPLYPVKQGLESAELYFAGKPDVRSKVLFRHAMRRMKEIEMLSDEITKSTHPELEEEGISRTMAMIRDNMNGSLNSAADEDDIADAENTIDFLNENFEAADRQLEKMVEREQVRAKKAMRDDIDDLRRYAKNKLQKVKAVSQQIKSPLRIKGPRVIMRQLMEVRMNEGEPPLIKTDLMPGATITPLRFDPEAEAGAWNGD